MSVALGDVNRPLLESICLPATPVVQAKFGCVVKALPNWSIPVAVNCLTGPRIQAGERRAHGNRGQRLAHGHVYTGLVAVRPLGSANVTRNV